MFIVLENDENHQTIVKGVHRQVKSASVQAWTLFLESKKDERIVQKYCSLGTKVNHGPTYTILCWDERPNENRLVGTWFLETPPLSLGKEQSRRQDVFVTRLDEYLQELRTSGRTPNSLYNNYMRHEKAAEDAE